jgi:cellulose biosynthesis protein BcsQ
VPLIPATLSSRTFEQLLAVVDSGPRLLAFFSMVDARKRLHREVIEELSATHPEVLRSAIPAAADVERMGQHRTAVGDFAPRSRAAHAYERLWSEVKDRIGGAPSRVIEPS